MAILKLCRATNFARGGDRKLMHGVISRHIALPMRDPNSCHLSTPNNKFHLVTASLFAAITATQAQFKVRFIRVDVAVTLCSPTFRSDNLRSIKS